ncbi:MAG: hypothetical protein JSV53_11170 [candidate division WOR-3 bacterium]|nr:MAG: hypothetical protein JSV53_11170 [candidate division WOR-3 bacterium]
MKRQIITYREHPHRGFPLLLILIFASSIHGAGPDTLWTKTYGWGDFDGASSICPTFDGFYVVTGFVNGSDIWVGCDLWLLKLNAQGDTLWTRTYGGSQNDVGNKIIETSDHGYAILGETESFGTGNVDIWLLKTNGTGDTTWTRTYGGVGWEGASSVQQTPDGGYIIVGSTASFGAGYADVYIIKTDADGITEWTRTYGGANWDGAFSVEVAAVGGYIVAGQTASSGAGNTDAWLLRTDTTGDTLWTRTYGGSDADEFRSIAETSSDRIVLAGQTKSSGSGDFDVWLTEVDLGGNVLWTRTYGGPLTEIGACIIELTNGYLVAGHTQSFGNGDYDIWLLRTNTIGDTIWTQTHGGYGIELGLSTVQTTDGGYIVAALTSSFGAGGSDVYLIELTPEVSIYERKSEVLRSDMHYATIINGPLASSIEAPYRIYDITGREVRSSNLNAGIYFIEIDGYFKSKIIKVR